MVFPVVMYGCESWTIKKVEHQRIDSFELWCWRRLLRVLWTARRSNQSILKEISPEYSLEGLMLKLNLQYFGPIPDENWLIWKDADAGKDWRQEEKGTTEDEMAGWHHWLDGHEFEQGDGQGGLACCSPWGRKESDMTEWLNWAEGHDTGGSVTGYLLSYSSPVTAATLWLGWKEPCKVWAAGKEVLYGCFRSRCCIYICMSHSLCFIWFLIWYIICGLPGGAKGKEPFPVNARDVRDVGSVPALGRSPGGGNDNPLQYSCLENPMDRGAWRATVYRVIKNWAWLKRLSAHNLRAPQISNK